MESDPTVSVLLPVRNGADFIADAISSILNQSFEDFELIIIDDGSSDSTRSVCLQFSDSRIVYLRNEDSSGIVSALNEGIRKARGSLIARIDSDDIALPERLQAQVEALQGDQALGLVGTWIQTFGLRRTKWKYPTEHDDIELALLFGNPFGHPSVMFRTNWLGNAKGFYSEDFGLAEDYELWSRLSLEWKCANIPLFLTSYRTHRNQVTQSMTEEREKVVAEISSRQFKYWDLTPLPRDISVFTFESWWQNFMTEVQEKKLFERANFPVRKSIERQRILRGHLKESLRLIGLERATVRARNYFEIFPPKFNPH